MVQDTAAAGYDQWCTDTLGADFSKYSDDHNAGYRDGISGGEAAPGPRIGDAMVEYEEGYASGHYQFTRKRQSGGSSEPSASTAPVPVSPAVDDPAVRLDQQYQGWLAEHDWQHAAESLNGFNRDDINKRLAALSADQIANIRQGALDNPRVGPDSQLTRMLAPGPPAALDLTRMSGEDKLLEAYRRAKLAPAVRGQIEALVTPKALVIAVYSFVGAFLVMQFTPVGWAADIGAAVTGIFVGAVLFKAINEMIAFADGRNARSEADLDAAGAHLANAFAEVAVNAVILLVTHGAGKAAGAVPYKGPPPSGFVEVVTDTGVIVRMPAEAAAKAATVAPAQAAAVAAKGVGALQAVAVGAGGGGSGSGPAPGPNKGVAGAPAKASPPVLEDKPGFKLTDFDKQTAGTGGVKSIKKGADPEGLYGVTIEGELKDPIPREQAPNYNASNKLFDPEGPGLDPKQWQKSHAVGPGFGDEAAAGLMEAPEEMNQLFQNRGVEGWMRDLHQSVKAAGGKVTYKVSVVPWKFPTPGGWSPTSGAEFLRIAEYRVNVEIPGRPSQSITIAIETAPPPVAKVANVTIEPANAVNPADIVGH